MEEYGYNPNNDPTLPAVGGGADSPDMTEDASGYRGWGNQAGSARKPSTNLSSGGGVGMAFSDDGQQMTQHSGGAPMSDGGVSGDGLVDGAAAGAAGGIVGGGVKRGPSNASSHYSAAGQTEDSEDLGPTEHGYDTNYSQFTPYRPTATNYDDGAQPVIQDVSARRNTRIENPSVLPKPGNSGIAANF